MFIEAMGYAGFDFVIIDLEHGPNTILNAQNLIRASEASRILPIIRCKEDVRSVVSEALDIGAGGVLVPKVTSAKEAQEIIDTARFAPIGMRGVCRYVRAAQYSNTCGQDYFKNANRAFLILGIEGVDAIQKIDQILELHGVDAIFIGPYDLSQSVGKTGDIDHPLVIDKMTEVIKKCQRKRVKVGTFVESVESANKWQKLGVGFLAYSVDVGLFYNHCKEIVLKFQNICQTETD
jgi:4-hydroxy-2-oxoheptanedioate aldolase